MVPGSGLAESSGQWARTCRYVSGAMAYMVRKMRSTTMWSIDNRDIVQTVVDLHERAKEAFEYRRKRYRQWKT
jgi:hypothetical protein